MTKQEEIREVLATLCAMAKVKDLTKSPAGFDEEIESAMIELDSLDVVIKGEEHQIYSNWFKVEPLRPEYYE